MDQEEYTIIEQEIMKKPLQKKEPLTSRLTYMATEKEGAAVAELAEKLGVKKCDIVRAGLRAACYHPSLMMCYLPTYISPEHMEKLAEAMLENDEPGWPENLANDALYVNNQSIDGLLTSDQYDALMEVINTRLSNREREIIFLLYKDGLTLRETGNEYGLSTERIRQVKNRALIKIHRRKPHILMGYREWVNRRANEIIQELYSAVGMKSSDEEAKCKAYYEDWTNPKVDILELSVRPYNCLRRAKITRISELRGFGVARFLHLAGLGRKSAKEIETKMNNLGFDLYAMLSEDDAENDPTNMTREEFNRYIC